MQNPLVEIPFDVPFDRIGPEHVRPAVESLIADAQRAIDAIVTDPAPRTYDRTLYALEQATERLELAMTIVGHLESVATTDELRAAYNEVQPKVSEFYSRIPLNSGLYDALRAFAATPEAAALEPTRRRFLDKTLADFRRHGAELPAEGKARLSEIEVELSKITTKFSQNVLDATNAFELVLEDAARLSGLPESARAAAQENAKSKGVAGYRFTLQAPSLLPVLTYADDANLRETLSRAYNTRASSGAHDNRQHIARILELRREKAKLLGFRDFADLVLEDRMAKNGDRAWAFVDDLRARTLEAFARENQALEALRRELEGADAPPLEVWDVAYYAEKQRKALFDFDEEELRPYFPADSVLDGLFRIVQRLYGITIEPRPAPAWDPEVRTYGIRDAKGDLVAAFYADLYPRENKRGGAWMNALITGVDGKPHLGLFCANVNPPADGKPALLTHREVETLFHEFGHLLHHCLSQVRVRSLAGTNVAWDFVELPSQIMENWCWEREALDLFARHYETGAAIPDALFEKMVRARTFRAANAQMRQLGFATIDLALHTRYDAARDGDLLEYARGLLETHSAVRLPKDHAMICGFSHLFASSTGYAAGYYSYKWAEVLDADAFTRFKREGVTNPETGKAFREAILERGDSAEPEELYRAFMGRDPELDALLERQGLDAA
jgi:oligopeptidase A